MWGVACECGYASHEETWSKAAEKVMSHHRESKERVLKEGRLGEVEWPTTGTGNEKYNHPLYYVVVERCCYPWVGRVGER